MKPEQRNESRRGAEREIQRRGEAQFMDHNFVWKFTTFNLLSWWKEERKCENVATVRSSVLWQGQQSYGQLTNSNLNICEVKWSRYRLGVVQSVVGGIALFFHDRGTRRRWGVSVTPRPHFTPGKDPVSIVQEAGWAPGPVWTGEKSRPHRDSIPDRPALSQSLCRLNFPAHTHTHTHTYTHILHIYIYIYIYIYWKFRNKIWWTLK